MGKSSYRVSGVEAGAAGAAVPLKPLSTKALRAQRRKSFFEGVSSDFDVDLDALRQAWVDWQFLARRRKKSQHPYTRLRLDFTPALERIYAKFSHGRRIVLHNMALPIVFVVFVLLCLYDTLKTLPPLPAIGVTRLVLVAMMGGFLGVTRFSRWKHNLTVHLFALNCSYLFIAFSITFSQYFNGEAFDGGMASNLCAFAAFLLVDTSLPWQVSTGCLCLLFQLAYLYVVDIPEYPRSYTHAVLASSLLTMLGGTSYVYMCVRLNRKLFLDQVLARLQSYQLEREKDRLNGLLHVILPKTIAARLKSGEQPISDRFEDATVMFVEVLEFDAVVAASTPLAAVKKLNKLYARFDSVCEKNHVMRIKIIGTTYMAICGIPSIRQHHAELACTAALAMRDELKAYCAEANITLGLRVGINSGPLVAGVIGVQKFCYDVWGDTVNTAARMCTHAAAGTIQTTQSVRDKIDFAFEFAQLDESFIKGKGKMVTHHLVAKKVFERRIAPVPQLDFSSFSLDVSKAGDYLLDGSRLSRPHLDKSLAEEAATRPRRGESNADKKASRQPLEESDSGSEGEREGGEAGGDPGVPRAGHEVATRSESRASSEETSDTATLPRQKSSLISQSEGRLNGISERLPGHVSSDGASSDGGETDASHRDGGQGLVGLVRFSNKLDDSMASSRTDFSASDTDTNTTRTGTHTPSAGLNRFRENLLRSATLDATAPDSARGVFLTSRMTARANSGLGTIDTHRMQLARNLALAYGFDGRSEADKEQAENAYFSVQRRACFIRFTDKEVELTFDERSVREAMGYARVAYLGALFLLVTGVVYDYLAFLNAAHLRATWPQAYTPAELQVPGLTFRNPHLTLGMLIGIRLALTPPFIIVFLLTYTRCAVRLVPYLSIFSVLWSMAAEIICMYISQPSGVVMGSSRIVAVIGSVILIMRGFNVQRQLFTMITAFILVMGGVFVSDPELVFTVNIASYTLPLFVSAAILRSRLQLAQRSYFIERMKVARRSKEIAKEQEKADQMLTNIFPKTIYERIKRGEREIVDNHKAAVVLFADVVGFTKMSMEYTPAEVVDTLNEIFSSFDELMAKYNLEKIKTIGDCFVCSAGVTIFNTSPFTNMANCALDMMVIMDGLRTPRGQKIEMRWGIHTGDVISAVVGEKKFLYDIFGEAVQTANLMESSSVAGRILVSDPVAVQLARSGFVLKQHKVVQTNSGAPLNTHFLMGRKKSGRSNTLTHDDAPPDLSALSAQALGVARTASSGSLTSSTGNANTLTLSGSPPTPTHDMPPDGSPLRSSASLSHLSVSAGSESGSEVALLASTR